MSVDCKGCGSHFNPYNKPHGGRHDKNSHAGDLGNITANENGIAKFRFVLYDKITMKVCIPYLDVPLLFMKG